MRSVAWWTRRELATALVAASVAGCHRAPEAASAPNPTVLEHAVTSGPAPPLVLRGSVAVRSRLPLGFRVAGLVREVRVRPGDRVRKGDLLATLDPGESRARMHSAGVAYAKALRDARAAEDLARSGSVAPTAQDDAKSALEMAGANAELAHQALRSTRLLAPVAGTILQRTAEPGEAIAASAPVVVLDETGRLIVKVGATSAQLERVRIAPSVALLDGAGRAIARAAVASLPASADAKTGIYDVELDPDPEWMTVLHAGDLVSARFDPPPAERALRVPVDAIVHVSDADEVFVVGGAPPLTTVHRRRVDLDGVDGTDFLVRAGLKPGDRVVAEGASLLRDGQVVDVAIE